MTWSIVDIWAPAVDSDQFRCPVYAQSAERKPQPATPVTFAIAPRSKTPQCRTTARTASTGSEVVRSASRA
ncbi:hypothetical protein Q0F99_04615 [Rathayibacter oskolensis]|uniref:hypothetical protein n=1 Tax=Rathayibacter oskolensis TaxID=1891671 RepID=UPI00265F974F|nr:hypothetical protein [Rathayibacter oskolensis]WKK72279.1 hypothetical protein Q0F99_04615 [Rathayibacter oskolensis]